MVEIIIVLGNSKQEVITKRAKRACEYFKATPSKVYSELTGFVEIVKYLIFSGGTNVVSKPEGVMMYEYALKNGIEEKCCIIEKKSRNTIENLRFSKEIIDKMFSNTLDYRPQITICTSSFHMKRAIVLAKLMFEGYQLKFIHTGEHINKEEYMREAHMLNNTLDGYCKQFIQINDCQ